MYARGRSQALAFKGSTFPVRPDQTDHPCKREPTGDKTEYQNSLTVLVPTFKSYECRDERNKANPTIGHQLEVSDSPLSRIAIVHGPLLNPLRPFMLPEKLLPARKPNLSGSSPCDKVCRR